MDEDGTFELNKTGWYTTQVVLPIEGFDPDQYGNIWYNVKFSDNAETIMWLAKEAPEENKKYYGHVEKTSSGKRLRFKRDKEPEDVERPSGAVQKKEWQPKNDFQITLNMVWKNMLQYFDVKSLLTNVDEASIFWEAVTSHTNELLDLGENIQAAGKKPPATSPEDIT